jgi:hypothetical protein
MSSEEIICPKGYYCPTYRTDIYIKCGNGTYCGEGETLPINCPAGQFGTGVTDNWDLESSCIPCGPGTYSDLEENNCLPCEAGFICY